VISTLLWSGVVLFLITIIMDYFLSSGTTTGVEPINTITMQPLETMTPTVNIPSPVLDLIHQFIPAELFSLINLPLL
jgi:hypothetical protein